MIAKGVIRVLGVEPAEYPKPRAGERPWDELTYWDRESRGKDAVTVLIDRQVSPDTYPSEGDDATVVFQLEQVNRVVKRQDREDANRTYDAAAKQFKATVIAFEAAPSKANGKSAASPAKAAA